MRVRARGGIGRRAGFRFQCRKACEFKSHRAHTFFALHLRPWGLNTLIDRVWGVSDQDQHPEQPPQRKRLRVRAWHVILLVAAVAVSLLLASWQWSRYTSGTGSLQNLGYALQWPMFGLFFVYIYRAGMKMENEKIDAENSGRSMDALYEADAAAFGDPDKAAPMTEISEDFLPQRRELDVEEFNELNTPRRRRPIDDAR